MKKAFMDEILKLRVSECTLDDLRRIADRVDCGLNEFPSVIEELRDQGTLMKKANGTYQIVI